MRIVKLTRDKDVFCYASFMNGTEKVDLTNIGKTTERVRNYDYIIIIINIVIMLLYSQFYDNDDYFLIFFFRVNVSPFLLW